MYYEINRNTNISNFNYLEKNRYEIGWVFLNILFSKLSFYSMVAFLAAFHCLVLYRFVKKYVPNSFYWFSIFIYVFNPSFLLIMSSSMRQTVAITFFILSLDFILNKKTIKAICLILISSLFHTSALFMIPFCFLGLPSFKLNTLHIGIIFVGIYITSFTTSFLSPATIFLSKYMDKYLVYDELKSIDSGFGVIFQSLILLMILYYQKNQHKYIRPLFNLSALAFLFIPLVLTIPMVGRLSMYFQIIIIIVYPYLIISIKNKFHKTIIITLLILFTIYAFIQFFNTPGWSKFFGKYQTIFS